MRRNNRNRNYRRKSASRRRTGRRTASPSLRRLRYLRRRGRQEAEASENDIEEEVEPLSMDELMEMVEEGPENEVEAEAMADAIAEAMEDEEMKEVIDANGDGVPDWCNPTKPMGAWLNFKNMRLWCAGKGWTKFGPYGGVPSQDEPEEEVEGNELDLLEEEDIGPLEEEEGLLEDQEE